jgi:hypothetical protein
MPAHSRHPFRIDLMALGAAQRTGLAVCVLAILWLAAASALT